MDVRDQIVVFRIGSLGDTLVALPAFRHIRRCEPDAHITLLTNCPVGGGVKAASSYQVLAGTGLVDDFIEYRQSRNPGDWISLLRELRRRRPVRIYYMMPVRTFAQRLRDIVFLALTGAKRTIGLSLGHSAETWRRLGPDRLESEASRLFRRVGGDPATLSSAAFRLPLEETDLYKTQRLLSPLAGRGPIIGASIGTKAAMRDWGDDRWRPFIVALRRARPDVALVMIGSADERPRTDALIAAFGGPALNLCGQLSPRESGALLAQLALFIGHDSGPGHLANAVGIPAVGIHTSRHPKGVWFPFGQENNVFYKDVSCAGCGLEVCEVEKMRCIRSIGVEEVLAKVLSLLPPQYGEEGEKFVATRTALPPITSESHPASHPVPQHLRG